MASGVQFISGAFRRLASTMGSGGSRALMSTREASFVQNRIKENCVVIFSKTTCPYCHMAKKVFDSIGTPYEAIEINTMEGGGKIQQVLKELTGNATVPGVFVNGQFIGGGTETKALHEQGKLLPLLEKCHTAS